MFGLLRFNWLKSTLVGHLIYAAHRISFFTVLITIFQSQQNSCQMKIFPMHEIVLKITWGINSSQIIWSALFWLFELQIISNWSIGWLHSWLRLMASKGLLLISSLSRFIAYFPRRPMRVLHESHWFHPLISNIKTTPTGKQVLLAGSASLIHETCSIAEA